MENETQIRTFLEMAGQGCVSGRVSEWPQLKPACKWAIERIEQLEQLLSEYDTMRNFIIKSLDSEESK